MHGYTGGRQAGPSWNHALMELPTTPNGVILAVQSRCVCLLNLHRHLVPVILHRLRSQMTPNNLALWLGVYCGSELQCSCPHIWQLLCKRLHA